MRDAPPTHRSRYFLAHVLDRVQLPAKSGTERQRSAACASAFILCIFYLLHFNVQHTFRPWQMLSKYWVTLAIMSCCIIYEARACLLVALAVTDSYANYNQNLMSLTAKHKKKSKTERNWLKHARSFAWSLRWQRAHVVVRIWCILQLPGLWRTHIAGDNGNTT